MSSILFKFCSIRPIFFRIPECNFYRLWDEYDDEGFDHELSISVPVVVKKVKRIVQYFNQSPKNVNVLRKELKKRKKPYRSLVQDCNTRWNSTFYLLKRFQDAVDCINVVLSKIKHDLPVLSAEEYALIPHVIEMLSLFESFTTDLSGETYVTISMIIPYVNTLYDELWKIKRALSEKFKEQHTSAYQSEVISFLNSLIESVEKKLFLYEEKSICA